MAGVLRISQVPPTATDEDVKNIFQVKGIYPLDIHWITNSYGKRTGNAFVTLQNKDLKRGTSVHGTIFRGSSVCVFPSSHGEFNEFFPSVPMIRDADWSQYVYAENNKKYEKRDNYQTYNYSSNHYDGNKNLSSNSRQVSLYQYNNGNSSYKPSPSRQSSSNQYNGKNKDLDSMYKPGNPRQYSSNQYNYATKKLDSSYKSNSASQEASYQYDYRSKDFDSRYKNSGSRQDFSFSYGDKSKEPDSSYKASGSQLDLYFDKDYKPSSSSKKSRSRSRSPHKSVGEKRTPYTSSQSKHQTVESIPKVEEINEKKFVRIFGMSFNSTTEDFKKFLKPLEVKEVYLLQFKHGENKGKPNGSAIIEFKKEEHASKAFGYDGKNFNLRPIQVVRTAREDITAALDDHKNKPLLNADLNTLNALANSNPQIQRLVGLLNDAVSSATKPETDVASSNKSSKRSEERSSLKSSHSDKGSSTSRKDEYSSSRRGSGSSSMRQKEDPIINRVASSANINVDDIKNGKVVGMRNLPLHVNSEMILHFFKAYHTVNDSVRIHYLDNGRCSGDAIIAFSSTQEARNAVKYLNKKSVDGQKVELFFL